ncbi:hypothetical protein ABZ705_34265 [Streptomyces sp. NPDC006984]|uniref:hypothetical protein n=1 Tax=Streptomyces sp. NPDC006984 TaxID=3155463 RepID=UPI0033D4304D
MCAAVDAAAGAWSRPATGLDSGGLAAVGSQDAAGDVVVQAARELAAAQGLSSRCRPASARTWRRANHGEDDRGDVDGGERGVDHRVHTSSCSSGPVVGGLCTVRLTELEKQGLVS